MQASTLHMHSVTHRRRAQSSFFNLILKTIYAKRTLIENGKNSFIKSFEVESFEMKMTERVG